MSLFIKSLIIVVIIFLLFILYYLLQKRTSILYNIEVNNKNNSLEGMDQNDPEYNNCYNSVESIAINPIQNPHGIVGNLNQYFMELPLKHMCIKGSANSAYTGFYVTDIMVNYVLSRGSRFLDFEVYYLPDVNGTYNACVGYSEDPLDKKPKIYNKKNVLFLDMLQASIDYAFNGGSLYKVINTGDPLFINIRMKTSDDNIESLYGLIQNILKKTSEDPHYSQHFTGLSVNGSTIVKKIMNKVIIVIEKHYLVKISQNDICNMTSNSGDLNKSFYSQLDVAKYKGCPPKSHANNRVIFECEHGFNLVAPDFNKTFQNNPKIYSSIFNYGNQVTMMQYYVIDHELMENEKMFKTYNSSFVPMAYCLNYINNYAVPEDLQSSGFFNTFPSLF